jgi:hypothetical protein
MSRANGSSTTVAASLSGNRSAGCEGDRSDVVCLERDSIAGSNSGVGNCTGVDDDGSPRNSLGHCAVLEVADADQYTALDLVDTTSPRTAMSPLLPLREELAPSSDPPLSVPSSSGSVV